MPSCPAGQLLFPSFSCKEIAVGSRVLFWGNCANELHTVNSLVCNVQCAFLCAHEATTFSWFARLSEAGGARRVVLHHSVVARQCQKWLKSWKQHVTQRDLSYIDVQCSTATSQVMCQYRYVPKVYELRTDGGICSPFPVFCNLAVS